MNQCFMSVDLVAFVWRFFVTNPNAVVLSVWVGIGGCLWPIPSAVVRAGIACCELIYSAPISASADEVITFFIICTMVKAAPLFSGFDALFGMKKIHQICSSLLVWSGRMHHCVLLGPCHSRCMTGWRQGVILRSLGSTLLCPLLLLLVLLVLMILR